VNFKQSISSEQHGTRNPANWVAMNTVVAQVRWVSGVWDLIWALELDIQVTYSFISLLSWLESASHYFSASLHLHADLGQFGNVIQLRVVDTLPWPDIEGMATSESELALGEKSLIIYVWLS
jgi:hypothetical protein